MPSKKKPSAAPKPLHIEIHGDAVDIVATFKPSQDPPAGPNAGSIAWVEIRQRVASTFAKGSGPVSTLSVDEEKVNDEIKYLLSTSAFSVMCATPQGRTFLRALVHVSSAASPEALAGIATAIHAQGQRGPQLTPVEPTEPASNPS